MPGRAPRREAACSGRATDRVACRSGAMAAAKSREPAPTRPSPRARRSRARGAAPAALRGADPRARPALRHRLAARKKRPRQPPVRSGRRRAWSRLARSVRVPARLATGDLAGESLCRGTACRRAARRRSCGGARPPRSRRPAPPPAWLGQHGCRPSRRSRSAQPVARRRGRRAGRDLAGPWRAPPGAVPARPARPSSCCSCCRSCRPPTRAAGARALSGRAGARDLPRPQRARARGRGAGACWPMPGSAALCSGREARAEQPICGIVGGQCDPRPDRPAGRDRATRSCCVDHKSNRAPPAAAERAPTPISASSRPTGRCSSRSTRTGRCAARLLWTEGPRLMALDDAPLDAPGGRTRPGLTRASRSPSPLDASTRSTLCCRRQGPNRCRGSTWGLDGRHPDLPTPPSSRTCSSPTSRCWSTSGPSGAARAR